MGVGLLAPVPAVHLKSAMETSAKAGRVAFGATVWDVFFRANEEYGKGIPVLIYASPTYGDPDKLTTPGTVGFRGKYSGTKLAVSGKHPNPDVRPATAMTDSGWDFFWEVSDLTPLEPLDRIILSQLTALGQKKPLSVAPRRPMLVKADFL